MFGGILLLRVNEDVGRANPDLDIYNIHPIFWEDQGKEVQARDQMPLDSGVKPTNQPLAAADALHAFGDEHQLTDWWSLVPLGHR